MSNPNACSSGGNIASGIDINPDQVAHGVGIFGAIETMQAGGAARIHMRRGRAVEFRLQPAGGGIIGGVIRPRDTRRRHRAAAQLHDHFFPGLRRIGHMHGVGSVQHEVRGLQLLVVTGDAVLGTSARAGVSGRPAVPGKPRP